MSYSFNHVHLKAPDPGATADWYVKAFEFEILNDENPDLKEIGLLDVELKMA